MQLLRTHLKIITYIILLFFIITPIQAQQIMIDSLIQELPKSNGASKIKLLQKLALLSAYSAPQKAIDYGQQSVDLSESLQMEWGIIEGLRIQGTGYRYQGKYELALDFFNKALVIAEKGKYQQQISTILYNIGVVHYSRTDYEIAMEYYLRALKIAETFQDKLTIGSITNGIANIHYNYKDFDQALVYFQKYLAIARALGNDKNIGVALNNLGSFYNEQNELDQALIHFKEVFDIGEKLEDQHLLTIASYNIGQIYLQQKEINLAKKYITKSIELSKQQNNKESLVGSLLGLGDIHKHIGNYKESNTYYLEGIALLKEMGHRVIEKNTYKLLIENYVVLNDYKEAYKNQQLLLSVKDSIFNKQRIEQVQELATKYETERKETENQLLKEQQIRNELELKQQSILGWITGLILGLVSIIAFILYRGNKQKKKYNQQLNTEITLLNKNLEHQKIIEEQSNKIKLAEQQKNKLFTNIAHELQTPLNIIQGLSKQLAQDESLTNKGYESLNIITRNSTYLSESTKQILALNLPNAAVEVSNFVLFSLQDLVESILPAYQFLAKEKAINLQLVNIQSPSVLLYSEVYKFETILKNLLSNAIKYTQREGTITLAYESDHSDYHKITIKDNGRGIPEEEIPTLFDRYFQSDSQKAEGGFGLGLAICKEYITSLKGTISIESQVGLGSTFLIKFPKFAIDTLPNTIEKYYFPKNNISKPVTLNESVANKVSPPNQILIVEDNLDFCKYLETILIKDYYLAFVHDGQQAIKYLKQHTPTLIITDWMMSGMDGLELVNYLKASTTYSQIPILMLTARSLTSDKLKALRAGIDDFIIKPIEAEVLKNRISQLLQFKEERTSSLESFPPLNKEDSLLSTSDQSWLIELEQIIYPVLGDYDLTIEHIAQLVNMNSRSLNRRIKNITGLTAKRYIRELRYWEARRMLETAEYDSVKAVCYSVGFKDTKYFSRKFKERFGGYPSEYLYGNRSI